MTERISIEGKDEIAILANGINHFIETLQNIMTNITANSRKLDEVVGGVSHSVATANASSVDISAVMEELSASMEEVASTVANVNSNTVDVKDNVEEIATASNDLLTSKHIILSETWKYSLIKAEFFLLNLAASL